MIQIVNSDSEFNLIRKLAYEIWPQCYGSILSDHQINYMLDKFYSIPSLKSQHNKGHQFFTINDFSLPIGFFSIEINSTNFGNCKIHKLYIQHTVQMKGLGSNAINYIVDFAKSHNQNNISLNVNRQNPAIYFYSKNEFQILKEEDIDIGNGYFMNDYVMIKKL